MKKHNCIFLGKRTDSRDLTWYSSDYVTFWAEAKLWRRPKASGQHVVGELENSGWVGRADGLGHQKGENAEEADRRQYTCVWIHRMYKSEPWLCLLGDSDMSNQVSAVSCGPPAGAGYQWRRPCRLNKVSNMNRDTLKPIHPCRTKCFRCS